MKSLFLTLSLTVLSSQVAAFAQSTCPFEEGDQVSFESIKSVFDELRTIPADKGEFETTPEFIERRTLAIEALSIGGAKLLGRDLFPYEAKYSADDQAFKIKESALSEDRSFDTVIVDLGEYEASNAMGVAVTVERSAVTMHEVVGEADWEFDEYEAAEFSWKDDIGVLHVAADTATARTLKDQLKVGLYLSVKEPFWKTLEAYKEPTVGSPTELVAITNSVISNVHCGVVTSAEGIVLKVIKQRPTGRNDTGLR